MRISFIIPTLRAGGSERIVTRLAAAVVASGGSASIHCLQPPHEAPFFVTDPRVELIRLDAISNAGAIAWPRAIAQLRASLRAGHPDVGVAFTTVGGLLGAMATIGLRAPLIIAERADPAAHGQRIGLARRFARRCSHALARHVVVQTSQARRALASIPDQRISVIANPIVVLATQALPHRPGGNGRFSIVAAGRFVPDKGFDRLLEAFGRLAARHPDWDLVIHGDGPLRPVLARQAAALGLVGRVMMPGTAPDLTSGLLTAHLFVLPSRIEGFANVLGEAAAAGLPAVAYAGVGGAAELIVPGATGLLANPDAAVDSLAAALGQLMSDALTRARMGAAARQHVTRFSAPAHDGAWLDLLSRMAGQRPSAQAFGRDDVRDHRLMGARRSTTRAAAG